MLNADSKHFKLKVQTNILVTISVHSSPRVVCATVFLLHPFITGHGQMSHGFHAVLTMASFKRLTEVAWHQDKSQSLISNIKEMMD